MARIKYFYDDRSCGYVQIRKSSKEILLKYSGYIFKSCLFSFVLITAKYKYSGSTKKVYLVSENNFLKLKYKNLQKDLSQIEIKLKEHENQDNLCRNVLNEEYLSQTMRMVGRGGIDHYKNLENLDKEKIIKKTTIKINDVKNKIDVQLRSYDEILKLKKKQNHFLACIPCIQPINKHDCKGFGDIFKFRHKHPVTGKPCMHNGQDLRVSIGKPVYATANGIIKKSSYSDVNGHFVIINHGYRTETQYLHLSKRLVKIGDKVNRGQLIGLSGNTGRSSGPHVHYGIKINGKHIDPRQYLFDNKITQRDYEKIKKIKYI